MITEDILKWLDTLPLWQQVIGHAILDNKKITDDELDEIYKIFKIESGLEKGKLPSYTHNNTLKKEGSTHHVVWKGVKNLHGVNRLKQNMELPIYVGMTVFYGENGSGKSGYTRLFNNAFISRGDHDILPNVFSEKHEDVSAVFKFTVDGTETEYKYPDEKDQFPFNTIRVFDAKAASNDMNKDSVIDFAPSELSFFDSFITICSKLQNLLDQERKEKKLENPTLTFLKNPGKALDEMKALSADSDITQIKQMFSMGEDQEKQLDEVRAEKANLNSLNVDKRGKQIDQVFNILNSAQKKYELFLKSCSKQQIDIYNEQIKSSIKYKQLLEINGTSLFTDEHIELFGSIEWKEFITSAKKYYDAIKCKDRCPLCGQQLHENDLIYKYWKFLTSDAENNLKASQINIKNYSDSIAKLDLTFLPESSVQEEWLKDNYNQETEQIKQLFKKANDYKISILESLNKGISIHQIECQIPDINGLIEKVNQKKKELNAEEVQKKIIELTKLENEYNDRQIITTLLPNIQNYIEFMKWDRLAEKRTIKTRNITNKQKELFDKYVTNDYLSTFENECKRLSAEFEVKISQKARSGQNLKQLNIKDNLAGKVLSEGEQRAVSIANFLTEVKMDSKNIGIVLDDPVSSLDHKRRSLIAKRLLEEAAERQVVVFTHEITFFIELKTEAENNNINFEQRTIRSICNEPGDISNDITWPGMNVKDRIKKLKDDLSDLNKVSNCGDLSKFYYDAKNWCELLRESWERAVEEILFNDAIQRFNPCVQTQRLKKAPFTHELYHELENGMTTCSSWCHDQAKAINGTVPTFEELVEYLSSFDEFCKKYRAK